MRTIYTSLFKPTKTIEKQTLKLCVLALATIFLQGSVCLAQQTFTFTSASATGSVGPTQAQVNAAYLSTNLNGSVVCPSGIQTFTIPATSNYLIDITGASGGNAPSPYLTMGGLGARMQGQFQLTAGTVLQILVGQRGTDGCGNSSGGGGSYVVANGTLLIAAGGGGGVSSQDNGVNGTTVTAGTSDSQNISAGGTNGSGGQTCAGAHSGGGGGGYITGASGNGATGAGGGGGLSFLNGGIGGASFFNTQAGPAGGFGGGGGGSYCTVGGGGGGGYSGGAGGQHLNICATANRAGGGGGGSFNSGTSQINTAGFQSGPGRVIIQGLCFISLTASGSNPLNPAICSGSSLTLTTNAASNYTWSNGNSTSTSIVVSPGSTTSYSVIGTSTANCVSSNFITVIVNSGPPVLSIANPSSNICLGRTVSLTATGALTYTWTNPGVVNGQTFTPSSTQIYTVNGQNGCGITTATTSIVVAPLPVSALATPTIVCEGYSAVLNAVSSVSGYTWQPVALFGPSVAVAPTVTTIYTVTASDGTCSGTQTLTLATKVTPTITVSPTSTMICQGNSVVLTANGGSSYNWMPGNLSGSTVTVSPSVSTLYSLTGTNSVGCYSTASQGIVVNASPTVNIVANKTTVCAGDAVNLFASGANTYVWTGGPSTSGYTVNPTASTVYTVTGTQTGNACPGVKTISITAIVSNVSVSSNTSVCPGKSATLVASGASTYVWNNVAQFGNGSYVATPNAVTVYTVVATTSSNSINCPITKTVQVGIFPTPTITIVATKSVICKAQSNTLTASGAATYSWGAAGSGPVIVVKPNNTTIYTATGIDANGCEGMQVISVVVNACSGVSEFANTNSGITVYPNPSAGDLTITSNSNIVLNLLNGLGQEIKVISLTEANEHKANVKDLANGVYFIVGENAEGKINQKIVVAK